MFGKTENLIGYGTRNLDMDTFSLVAYCLRTHKGVLTLWRTKNVKTSNIRWHFPMDREF